LQINYYHVSDSQGPQNLRERPAEATRDGSDLAVIRISALGVHGNN